MLECVFFIVFRFQESDLDDIHFDQQYVTTQATVVSYKKITVYCFQTV